MVTRVEQERALDTLKRWDAQQAQIEKEKRQQQVEALRATIAELYDSESLHPWALAKWEQDKSRGIGRGMNEVQAVRYYLEGLKRSLADVCQAFQVDPTVLMKQ